MTLLVPACGACAALCCMAFAFEPGEDFALAKPAGVACPNLGADDRCRVHDDRERLGWHGCIRFDCKGAGQRVTQEVFGGRHWRDRPELAVPMIEAFRIVRGLHEVLELVVLTDRLPLTGAEAARRGELIARLDPPGGWSRAALADPATAALVDEARAFLASLRERARGLRPASA